MYSITDDEVEYILNDIEKRGVTTEDVRYNILDHVCCIIENEFNGEKDFNKFYENTIARFYKKELSEIERETENLLTFKYYFAMKRTLKITGLITVILILMGALFKTMHWYGASVMIISGFFFFCFIFIPLNIILTFRDSQKTNNRIVMTLGMTLTIAGTIGLLFKVMHWPFANILFMGSLAVFGLIFIPLYFFTRTRNPETKFNAIINTTFMIAAAGMLFTLINLRPSHYSEKKKESIKEVQVDILQQLKNTNGLLLLSIHNKETKHTGFAEMSQQIVASIDNYSAESLKELSAKVEKYNATLTEINSKYLKVIDNKNLGYLPDNADVLKLQILSNENAYLFLASNN